MTLLNSRFDLLYWINLFQGKSTMFQGHDMTPIKFIVKNACLVKNRHHLLNNDRLDTDPSPTSLN